jgi:CheY-like chemotaxis protein
VKTVLVVEGNEVMREGLAAVLRRQGYHVEAVADGRQALNHLRGHPAPDLVLLDMLMPVLDGWALLKEPPAAGATAALAHPRRHVNDPHPGVGRRPRLRRAGPQAGRRR